MANERPDVIIVGAGPAGSAAAVTLARSGRHVLLLDRAAFPRDKPCGDLIGARAMAAARSLGVAEDDLAPYARLRGAFVAADAGAVDLAPRTRLGRAALSRTDARVIPRAVFDAAMVRAAERAGAEVRQITVRGVSPWSDSGREVTGKTADGEVTLRSRAVIIAGGYGCRVAPELTAEPGRAVQPDGPPRGIAMRGYFTGVDAPPGRIAFCLNEWVLPGYGWVFPLPDGGANVGVGTLTEGGADEHLRALYE
ncbi:MAG: FAD-dependent monooxygenase, partial [Chloroflexota bacterium]|nr:FAD-dependent monooxygenase [Chloroflexota bacterium]